MGILSYYKNLITTFQNVTSALRSLDGQINFLYFDFNGMIHPSVGKVISKYQKSGKKPNPQTMEREMFTQIRKDAMEIINRVNPRFVMFAVDGVAPRAKMVQQRTRRYMSIVDKEKKDRRIIFDTNAISPGTMFMKNLSKYMNKMIDEELKDKKVLFLGQDVPGEGEHKIINFIKDFSAKDKVNHVIVGLDADLIMLSMTTGLDNIYLMREKQVFEMKNESSDKVQKMDSMEKKFQYLPIKNVKDNYWKGINKRELKTVDEEGKEETKAESLTITKEQFTKDLIPLMFFIGNDFLPKHKIVNAYKNGIDLLLESYKRTSLKLNTTLVTEDNKFNMEFLRELLKPFAEDEMKLIEKNNNKNRDRIIRYSEKGWINRFYDYYGVQDREDVAKNYCQMVRWTLLYYFEGTRDWQTFYRYPCPPVFQHLYKFITENDINEIQLTKSEPCTQHQQLMMILPPHSSFLLPNHCKELIHGKLRHLYPGHFKVDRVDKKVSWTWTPILPFIKYDEIRYHVRT